MLGVGMVVAGVGKIYWSYVGDGACAFYIFGESSIHCPDYFFHG
jgi:hypothetical protein